MIQALHEKLRELFGEARSVAIAAIDALELPKKGSLGGDDAALSEATLRLQQITAEITAVQDSEAR